MSDRDFAENLRLLYPFMALTVDEILREFPNEEERKNLRARMDLAAKQNYQAGLGGSAGDDKGLGYTWLLAQTVRRRLLDAYGGEEAIVELGRKRAEGPEIKFVGGVIVGRDQSSLAALFDRGSVGITK